MSKKYNKSKTTILVAEDDGMFRTMLCQFLEKQGFKVLEACDGEEAVEVFKQHDPQLVLMDAEMPKMNGLEASKIIREIDQFEYSPVLMITASENHDFVEHAFAAGVADFIHKPIHWALLQHKIDYMLQASADAYATTQSEEYLINLFQSLPLGYQSLNEEGNFIGVNPAWSSITGYSKEDVQDKPFIDFMHADSVHSFLSHFFAIFKGEASTNIPFQMVRKDGAIIDVEFSGQISKDKQGCFLQTHCLIVDVTVRKTMEEKLIKMATIDSLTETFNRRAFLEQADAAWKQSSRYYRPLTTLMIDIDFFKGINDSYGHATGDRVLKDVANTCQQALRETDTFGRLGGEEFAVLLPETGQDDALLSAERIRKAIENLQFIEKNEAFSITVSIGLAQRQPKDESFELLLHRADEALYKAKEDGRNRVEISL